MLRMLHSQLSADPAQSIKQSLGMDTLEHVWVTTKHPPVCSCQVRSSILLVDAVYVACQCRQQHPRM